jgi:hypothetical protein
MPVSQAAREALVAPVLLFQGDATNIGDTESPGTVGVAGPGLAPITYKVLSDCTLKRLAVVCLTLTGSSQFTCNIVRDAIIIASVSTATPGVAGTWYTSDVDVDLDKDDVLGFYFTGSDADTDDATGVEITGLLQLLRDQSDA